MKNLVVLSGAGMSAESGIPTFRGSDGLWEGHRIEDVASPNAWNRNPVLVQDFYNLRRKAIIDAVPNAAHLILAELEQTFNVQIVTQNIDDLHERAGSSHVLHLHGEIRKSRSTTTHKVYDINGGELNMGDRCPNGGQLRPHIVWFGEPVPLIETAVEIIMSADLLLVIGTSLVVYPAAGLVDFAPADCELFVVDPQAPKVNGRFKTIPKGASEGMEIFKSMIF